MGASGASNNTSVDLDYRYSYKVEDTPVTFSRNSSLSSLSVNSNDDEPSAEDQALLDSCISWGMPKSKSDGHCLTDEAGKTSKAKAIKTASSGSKAPPVSQSWDSGVRRAGDGQASASSNSSTSVTASNSSAVPPSPAVVDPSDIAIKLEETEGMTHSSLIRIEANEIAAQIQQLDISSQPQSLTRDIDQQSSLLSPSLIEGISNWSIEENQKSPSMARKSACQPDAAKRTGNPLLKQALSSGLPIASDGMVESCSSSRIEQTKPPPGVQESVTSLTCSVLDPAYFDDEQRREGLLTQLAIMEQTVDENANTDNNSVSSSPTEKRKLTPRDRRQMDKERYQTYTLNANPVDDVPASPTDKSETEVKKSPKDRRSEERFKTQTIWSSPTPRVNNVQENYAEKGAIETNEKMMKSISASELSTLELDAKAVIRTLREEAKLSRKNSNSSEFTSETYDLLDCETLSLVSNESESDRYCSISASSFFTNYMLSTIHHVLFFSVR